MNSLHSSASFWRAAAINMLLVTGSLILFALACEALLRVVGYNPFGELLAKEDRAVFIRPSENPQRIFEAAPNTAGHGWGTDVTINRFGFRGRDYRVEKPPGTFRIAVLGDSITFGNNLPADQNYPALLEKKFADAGKNVEVLNLALGGYDTLQEVATLEDIGLPFHPDLVLLGYCINDIGIASGNLNYIKRLQKYGSPVYRLRIAQWLRVQLDRLDQEHYLASANQQSTFHDTYQDTMSDINSDNELASLMKGLSGQLAQPGNHGVFTAEYADADHLRRLRFALEKLHALQQQQHFSVGVIIFPYLLDNDSNRSAYEQVYHIVEHEMTKQDFRVIDIIPSFEAAGHQQLLLRNNDGIHPNGEGHRIVAETLLNTFNTQITAPQVPSH